MKEDDGWLDYPWLEDGFIDALVDKISILDILDKYEIDYFKSSSGNFTHKLKCPMPNHDERTASFCFSDIKNDFHCFGCNFNGNIIEFIRVYRSTPFYHAASILNDYLGKDILENMEIKPREKINPEHLVMTHVFRSGVEIRKFIENKKYSDEYKKWILWSNKQFQKLDYYLDNFDDDKWEITKKYYDKLKNFLSKRG